MPNFVQSTGQNYDPIDMQFGKAHLFDPRTRVRSLKLEKISSDIPLIYIFERYGINGKPNQHPKFVRLKFI